MPRYVVLDIETDDLNATKIWICVTKDLGTGERKRWFNSGGLSDYLSGAFVIGHNILWFDAPVLNRLWGTAIDYELCIDTLVVSRLINSWDYSSHSLSNWGDRLGFPKGEYSDWSQYSEQMATYCERDVDLTERIFNFLKKYIEDPRLKRSMQIEHRAAIICRSMHDNGFGFDITGCTDLYKRISDEIKLLSNTLRDAFPPRQVVVRSVLPILTAKGTINRRSFTWLPDDITPESIGAKPGVPYHIYETVEFNPTSTKQIIERMWEFGWNPTEKTKGHVKAEKEKDIEKLSKYKTYGWTISDENLATLPATAPDAAKSLTRYILLSRRLTTLDEWIEAYDAKTKAIHGQVNSIGTWTHRASHTKPNTGNITSVDSLFGEDMRTLWQAGKGYRQVGCDAEGIQLRVLAHYMESTEFTEALVRGRSEDGTDVHTLNWRKLNGGDGDYPCRNRKTAKTFIYSYLLGAGVAKTAQIFGCSPTEATTARNRFVSSFPGLQRIKEELIPSDAHRGYFIGLDGRPVICDNEHLMLAGYLQNAETVVMKLANWHWWEILRKEKIPFWQMAYVHDEWQTRTIDNEDVANYVGKVQADSIVWAGEELGMKCPLAGKYVIGYNWKGCH